MYITIIVYPGPRVVLSAKAGVSVYAAAVSVTLSAVWILLDASADSSVNVTTTPVISSMGSFVEVGKNNPCV